MVSTHLSSHGIVWFLGGKDLITSNTNTNTNTNTQTKKSLDYVIVEIPEQQTKSIKGKPNKSMFDGLIYFINYILDI